MEKIEKVSPEQWQEAMKYNQLFLQKYAKITDRTAQKKAVEKLYQLSGKNSPLLIHCFSPMEAILILGIFKSGADLRDNLGNNIRANLGANLGNNFGNNLEYNLWDSLRDNLRDNLWDNLWDNLRDNLWDNLGANLGANLGNNLRNNLGDNLGGNTGDNLRDNFWDFGYNKAYLGWLLGGRALGVKFSKNLEIYQEICENIDGCIPFEKICFIWDHPIKCEWSQSNQGIHCETGAAVEWSDGYKLWAIEGYLVPESVVLQPELQTLAEINAEKNSEIKRIRINRYGWSKYLSESSAKVVDANFAGNAWESLMECDGYKVLCTYDPSTGRPYALEVDPACQTCEEAQRYLLAPNLTAGLLGLNPAEIKTYPKVRT